MKPIMLHGHERAITQIRYNREGDLLFSAAKDPTPNVWYSLNGERLGTFHGHTGACWCIDVDWNTQFLVSGAADNTCKLWDCRTGKNLNTIQTKSAVRSCGFSYGADLIMFTTDKAMGNPCQIYVFDRRTDSVATEKPVQHMVLESKDYAKITCCVWGNLDEHILAGHDNGSLSRWDMRNTIKLERAAKAHSKHVNDIQLSPEMAMFVTSSKDCTAKLFNSRTLEHLKTYTTDRPVNSASISPTRQHVVVGGGQEAMDVTTTSTRVGKFDARFFHLVLEEEFGRVKGHFGPINSVRFHPDGERYSSGGEDGYVRVHNFDQTYKQFQFEC